MIEKKEYTTQYISHCVTSAVVPDDDDLRSMARRDLAAGYRKPTRPQIVPALSPKTIVSRATTAPSREMYSFGTLDWSFWFFLSLFCSSSVGSIKGGGVGWVASGV
jgi:hypothetical protein